MLYATLAIYLAFCWIDRLGNWYQVIMPAYALLAVGLGAGAGWLWRRIGERGASGRGARVVRGAIILGLAILVIYRGVVSYPRAIQAIASRTRASSRAGPSWPTIRRKASPC